MKKFVTKFVIFILVISFCLGVLAIICLQFVAPQYSKTYQASLVDKVERVQSVQSPKIVLIGNSNLTFGIKSEKIEEALDMPVVNMGLHGALGNAFHEEMAKINVGEGDIVVICHTNYADEDSIEDSALAWITVENHRELWQLIRKKDVTTMLYAFPNYMLNTYLNWITGKGKGKGEGQGCYAREAFNEYGDVAVERDESEYTFEEGSVEVPKINDVCTERLNELNQEIRAQGATMVVAGYPIGNGEYTPDAAEFREFQQELEEKLDCPVISDFIDYMIDYKYFYDTCYHLTDEGAEIRTKQLIEDLEQYLNGTKNR